MTEAQQKIAKGLNRAGDLLVGLAAAIQELAELQTRMQQATAQLTWLAREIEQGRYGRLDSGPVSDVEPAAGAEKPP